MKRFGKIMSWLFFVDVVVVVVAVGAALALLASPKSLPWLVAEVERLVPGFTAREVSGHFFSSWSAAAISYRRGDFAVVIDQPRLRWRGEELLHGLVVIDELAASGIRLELPPASPPDEKKTPDKPRMAFFIPSWLRLRLEKLAIGEARIISAGHEILVLDNLAGGGEIGAGMARIKDLHVAGKVAAGAESIRFAIGADGTLAGLARPDAALALNSQINLWPGRGFAPVAGVLTVHGSLAKPELVLRLSAPAPVTLSAQAEREGEGENEHWRWRGQLSGGPVDPQAINAAWRPARIALDVAASGLDARYQATATGSVTVPGKGESQVALRFAGDARELTLEECRLTGAFGRFTAKGDLAWAKGFSWRGEIEADGFDPAFFVADYPGALDAALSTSGAITADSREVSLTIGNLSGQVRGYPVTGSGGLHFAGDTLTIDSLTLASGAARLNLAGQIAEQASLTAGLSIPDLGEVLAQAGGGLEARATVDGAVTRPRLAAQIKGRDLSFAGRQLALLTADFTGVWAEAPADRSFSGQLQAERLNGNGKPVLDALKLTLDGTLARHQAELSLRAPPGEAALRLLGGIKEKSWDGVLDSVSLAAGKIGHWRQDGAARLTLSADKGQLEDFRLRDGEGSFRLTAGFTGEGAARLWHVTVSDGKLPLSLLPLAPGMEASGLLAFDANAEGTGARLVRGRLSVHAGQADLPGIPVLPGLRHLRCRDTRVGATVDGGVLAVAVQGQCNRDHDLAANLTLTAPEAAFDLANVLALRQAPLAGWLRLNMGNLNFVGPVSHYTVMPSGAVMGDFTAHGTPIHPRLIGKVTMAKGGQVEITSSGISIGDVLIDADIDADALGDDGLTLNLTVHGTSGPGRAIAVGVLKFPRTAPFFGDFSVTGGDCEIFRRPEYHIRAIPKGVRMFFDGDHGELTGDVVVTWAEIVPERIQGSVSASDDLVILDADEQDQAGWQFLTDMHIQLGDEVHFSGYGLTGLLRGNLNVRTNRAGNFIGQGALQLADGAFVIFGRRLQIERGRLSFAGGPIDDPLLDVRAQKAVLSRGAGVHEILVGVDVSGSVHDPEFELFANEPLSEREILTYLLSGTSASPEVVDQNLLSSAAQMLGINDRANLLGGMGLLNEMSLERNDNDNTMSLLVGRRLTNDLFIGYDHNFVGEGGGAFRIRYNLGRGFTVETSSSGNSSSADLFYSFSR